MKGTTVKTTSTMASLDMDRFWGDDQYILDFAGNPNFDSLEDYWDEDEGEVAPTYDLDEVADVINGVGLSPHYAWGLVDVNNYDLPPGYEIQVSHRRGTIVADVLRHGNVLFSSEIETEYWSLTMEQVKDLAIKLHLDVTRSLANLLHQDIRQALDGVDEIITTIEAHPAEWTVLKLNNKNLPGWVIEQAKHPLPEPGDSAEVWYRDTVLGSCLAITDELGLYEHSELSMTPDGYDTIYGYAPLAGFFDVDWRMPAITETGELVRDTVTVG